ncbi:MAG: M6 family metalloprotease domain-containing protein [Gemmatimonadota bacterium]|nr:MAG: M6 family metalloprotease domain-containing protein [Gemmatimonadota bacterium]
MRGWILIPLTAAATTAIVAATAPPGLSAQDVEMRGRLHGTRPPSGYYEVLARDPNAYQLQRAWKEYARRIRERRQALAQAGDYAGLNTHFRGLQPSVAAAQAMGTAVSGTFRYPVLLGLFSDSTHSVLPDRATLDSTLFSTVLAPPYSVTTYYDEVSNGLLTVTGDVVNWVTVDSASTWYEGENNGLDPRTDHLGDYIEALLDSADAEIDFSQYDADEDGYVDLLAILHPLRDGVCRSSHIWAHAWIYRAWKGAPYLTDDGVHVDDYVIQSAVGGGDGCTPTQPMAIGIMVHELGHGILGLPDLYDTGVFPDPPTTEGIGHWGLMGSGNWNTPASPAHLSAWSKDDVGWITVEAISAQLGDTTRHALDRIVTGDAALRIDIAWTTEYFLVENRRRTGSDAQLHGEGLLIWHITPQAITDWRPWNQVNAHTPHGVKLEQADGRDDLGERRSSGGNRGDSGDPYPGATFSTTFGRSTVPDSRLSDGSATGLQVDSITVNGDMSMAFRVNLDLLDVAILTETLADGVVGAYYADTVEVAGGTEAYSWTQAGGDPMPAGLSLAATTGAITGVPEEAGTFELVLEGQSGPLSTSGTVTIVITEPTLALDAVIEQLLRIVYLLTPAERRFLDIIGNQNGGYDVGDFRAYLQKTGMLLDAADGTRNAGAKEGER